MPNHPWVGTERLTKARILAEELVERFGDQDPPESEIAMASEEPYDIFWSLQLDGLLIEKRQSYEGTRVKIEYRKRVVYHDDSATSSGVPLILHYEDGEWKWVLKALSEKLRLQRSLNYFIVEHYREIAAKRGRNRTLFDDYYPPSEDNGTLDVDFAFTGIGKPQKERARRIKQILEELGGKQRPVSADELLQRAVIEGIGREKAEKTLERLFQQGELCDPKPGHVMITGSPDQQSNPQSNWRPAL